MNSYHLNQIFSQCSTLQSLIPSRPANAPCLLTFDTVTAFSDLFDGDMRRCCYRSVKLEMGKGKYIFRNVANIFA